MPHSPIRCPFAEFDFRHPRRLYPMRVFPQPARRRWIKRSPIDLRFLQLPAQIQTELVAPPRTRAHLARESERAALVVSDQDRSNAHTRAGRIRESTNHEFLPPYAFDLLPIRTPRAPPV